MSRRHTAEQGDCLSSIGLRYGFAPDTLWDDPQNDALKRERENPDVLRPGDVVVIPELTEKQELCPSGRTHTFKRRGVPAYLRLQLVVDGEPIVDQPCTIDVDGEVHRTRTDGDGHVRIPIPPGARRAKLVAGRAKFELELGALDPITTIAGVKARLNNLHYPCGAVDDQLDDRTRMVLRWFQTRHGLRVTGEPDRATRDKLVALHGS